MQASSADTGGHSPPQAHRTAAVVGPGGTLHLEHLPFVTGATVDVIVYEGAPSNRVAEGSLHGSVLRYDDPFGPAVPPEDWEAAE